jgi:diguanylate cyclase (GGDEF)-like protein/PAS domain S-box-containing protein
MSSFYERLKDHNQSGQMWIWATIVCSALICSMLFFEQYYQQNRIERIARLSKDLGYAKTDLAQGFLHITLGNSPDSPWQREQGLALLTQALNSYESAAATLSPAMTGLRVFRQQLAAFRDQLAQQPGERDSGRAANDLKLRISMHELIGSAVDIDRETRAELIRLSAQQRHMIALSVGLSALILGGLCFGTYRVIIRNREERMRTNRITRENEQRWRFALEGAGDGVWDWNIADGNVTYSRRWKQMLGYDDAEIGVLPGEWSSRINENDAPAVRAELQRALEGKISTYASEYRVLCKDGSWKWVLDRGMVINRDASGAPARMICTLTDITERKNSEFVIWKQANFDDLTGLPNKAQIRARLDTAIRDAGPAGRMVALLFIDLDHFREVNDTLGHRQGDLLLTQAAERIRACLEPTDSVSRQGGDEFTVILPALCDRTRADRVAAAIVTRLGERFILGSEQAFISASIGITIYPDDADEPDALFRNADQALYAAKEAGRNGFAYYTSQLQEVALFRRRLTNDLRLAQSLHQLSVVYQPIVELATGKTHKAEALLRWRHPTLGAISPAEFIPLAEKSGLIVAIGNWVFQEAAAEAARLRASHHPQFQISVNKSPVQFRDIRTPFFSWPEHLASLGLPGDAIVVEITEGLLLDQNIDVTRRIHLLRESGIGISLDDFGTGYSSLSYLQKYDIDFLKIDQSFMRQLSSHSRNFSLCKSIVMMAHDLGMKVIAEGVETEEQKDLLVSIGCDYAQGYFFSRPLSATEFDAHLKALL